MKILVVSGSPRKKGNTMSMVKIVENNMKNIDESIDFEYCYLIEKDLRYCRGCSNCLRQGGGKCPIKDDAHEILQSMHKADGIIFASPGYAAMVSGLFKNFIDRFMYLDHIPELIAKPVLIVSTAGGDGVMGAPKFMANNSFYWWGCNIVDIIGIPHAFYVLNDKYRKKIEKQLLKSAERFYDAVRLQPKPRPKFIQYLYFMFNKTELQISSTVMPYRTKIWNERGWINMDYYYKTHVNPVFKIVGAVAFGMMKIVYRNIMGKNADTALAEYVQNN